MSNTQIKSSEPSWVSQAKTLANLNKDSLNKLKALVKANAIKSTKQ